MTTNFSNRKRVEPFVPTHFYYSSINDPQKIFTDIITGEMERKIGEILEKKEKEENEKKNSQGKVINGVYQKKEPDYGWLMDSKLKERKNLSFLEYSHVSDLIEKTTSSEWNVLIDLWGWELDSVTTRNEVIKTFEECVYKIISNRLQLLPSSASVDDVAISMKQLMDKEESEKSLYLLKK